MKYRRLLTILVILTAVAVACGDAGATSVTEKVRDEDAVRIGVRNDNPPLSFLDGSGAWVGFDVDLASAMADELGLTPELVVVSSVTPRTMTTEPSLNNVIT